MDNEAEVVELFVEQAHALVLLARERRKRKRKRNYYFPNGKKKKKKNPKTKVAKQIAKTDKARRQNHMRASNCSIEYITLPLTSPTYPKARARLHRGTGTLRSSLKRQQRKI
jgi:hypothetical protein